MKTSSVSLLPALAVAAAALACSPSPATDTPAAIVATLVAVTDTPPSPPLSSGGGDCSHPYNPADDGAVWEYVGTSSSLGQFSQTDTITDSRDDGFTLAQTNHASDVTFTLEYTCTYAGLTMLDAFQQSIVASVSGVSITTIAQSGVTLPADLEGASTWQQYVHWTTQGGNVANTYDVETTIDYVSRGFEYVTVPAGTFQAIHVDAIYHTVENGEAFEDCLTSAWVAKDIGVVKGEQSCFGIDTEWELLSFSSS
jgi:hypothetical protein